MSQLACCLYKPDQTNKKILLPMSQPSSRELHFCRMRRTSYTMDGFCLLYLLLILLMRSGDVETNPGPNTAESTVSEMEFMKLAQDIAPSYYFKVGISLGIPYAQLQVILIQTSNNYTNALLDVFMKWNVMHQPPHSNRRQLLADTLREIDLGSLSDRLLNEPHTAGGPSRLLESQIRPPSAESQTKPLSAESQTKPLSPELVGRCANDFKFKYRSTVCKIRADPLNPASIVPLADMYTNLVLLEEHGTEERLLEYNNILDLKVNGEFPKRIMVQGEAGAGKTTFCAKIAWDWIEGSYFSQFVWVLIVPLREFKQHTIGEIAKSYLAQNNPATVSQITEYIQSNPEKVFIAFDGLDEVSGKIMKTKSCASQPTDQMQLQPSQPSVNSSRACRSSSETGDIRLIDILCSDQLASCPVLVTTRPWRAVEIRSDSDLMKLYTFIHIKGFNGENFSDYIHKYFPKNDDKANQLIEFTSVNDVIPENMAINPIYVAMLCLMWKEFDEHKLKVMKSLDTFSQIFKEMIAFLKEHYAQKMVKKVGSPSLHAYLKNIDELLGPIAKQALNGLLQNTLIFDEDDFQICPESKDTACRVGILSQEDRITISMDIHESNPHVQLPVFFPHKLFQEYMAGVHLASLYESDRNEFNRLIEQVVLPRKKEFRYLLYFTVSKSKSIATHILQSMLQELPVDLFYLGQALPFIVDVAFESQDPDVAALVKDSVSSKAITLFIGRDMTAHTVAGYVFIGPNVVKLHIDRDCGPTMSLDVAEIICSMPSLEEIVLSGILHHCSFETLARKGKESKVQILRLNNVTCRTPAPSHHLAEALCSMPNLTDLELGRFLDEGFYSTLKAKASSIQVQILRLHVHCPTPASSHHLAESLCLMPNLIHLTLGPDLNEEFYSTLRAFASFIQVKILEISVLDCFTPGSSSHHLAKALGSMPNLTKFALGMILNDEFYSTLITNASSIQVHTFELSDVKCPTPASSHHLAEALCSMPNLTHLTIGGYLLEEFYSTLKPKASYLKVQTLMLYDVTCRTPASSHHLAEALCSMPNLIDLTLGMVLNEEFYSTLKAKASSIQVQTLKFEVVKCPTLASSHFLVEALCSMPNLTDLTLGSFLYEDFYYTLKAKASSLQVFFPQIRKGNFRFNGIAHNDLDSFLHALTCLQRSSDWLNEQLD